MCYHISIPEKRIISATYNWTKEPIDDVSYHHLSGFSFAEVPIITGEQPYKFLKANWGLIPFWVKSIDQTKKIRMGTLNARADTVFNLPSFRSIISKKRCLLIVDGFYEWHTVGKNKYPFYIYLKDSKAFSMGGIYDEWADHSTGEIFTTCSIVTVPGNPLMSKIHNKMDELGKPDPRMPLILNMENEKAWIDPNLTKDGIDALMKPFEENRMKAHTISKLITSRKVDNNVPAVKEVFTYPEMERL